jgi:hypothetical protein
MERGGDATASRKGTTMSRQKIIRDASHREGDVTATTTADGVVTVTVGDGDDRQHLELSEDQALRVEGVISAVTRWNEDD